MPSFRLCVAWPLWSLLAITVADKGDAFLMRRASSSSFVKPNLPHSDKFSISSLNFRSSPTPLTNRKVTSCALARQDNLVSGLAEISFAFSLGVLWSEFSVIQTGCGPLDFSDTLERICYQGVIASSGVAVFNRIVTMGSSLKDTSEEFFGPLEDSTLWQVQIAEYSSGLAVLGAFVALGVQTYVRGANMDGLSGIDVELCRAIRDL